LLVLETVSRGIYAQNFITNIFEKQSNPNCPNKYVFCALIFLLVCTALIYWIEVEKDKNMGEFIDILRSDFQGKLFILSLRRLRGFLGGGFMGSVIVMIFIFINLYLNFLTVFSFIYF
jgi:hypothetical protein